MKEYCLTLHFKHNCNLHTFYTGYIQNFQATLESQYPTEKDLQASVETLLRLQDTYGLKTSSMADGHLLKKQSSAPLMGNVLTYLKSNDLPLANISSTFFYQAANKSLRNTYA